MEASKEAQSGPHVCRGRAWIEQACRALGWLAGGLAGWLAGAQIGPEMPREAQRGPARPREISERRRPKSGQFYEQLTYWEATFLKGANSREKASQRPLHTVGMPREAQGGSERPKEARGGRACIHRTSLSCAWLAGWLAGWFAPSQKVASNSHIGKPLF